MENNGGEKSFVYSADQKTATVATPSAQTVATPAQAPSPQIATPVTAPVAQASISTTPPSNTQVPTQPVSSPQPAGEGIQWQASEFIDHQKSALWFIALVIVAIVASVVIYFLTGGGVLAPIVVGMSALAFATIARQKPRSLQYALTSSDITVGQKKFSYDDFKAFSVVQDGALYSIVLEPTKRFMPPLTIYFASEDGEKIFDTLAQHLPHEDRQLDAVDRMMRKIRF